MVKKFDSCVIFDLLYIYISLLHKGPDSSIYSKSGTAIDISTRFLDTEIRHSFLSLLVRQLGFSYINDVDIRKLSPNSSRLDPLSRHIVMSLVSYSSTSSSEEDGVGIIDNKGELRASSYKVSPRKRAFRVTLDSQEEEEPLKISRKSAREGKDISSFLPAPKNVTNNLKPKDARTDPEFPRKSIPLPDIVPSQIRDRTESAISLFSLRKINERGVLYVPI